MAKTSGGNNAGRAKGKAKVPSKYTGPKEQTGGGGAMGANPGRAMEAAGAVAANRLGGMFQKPSSGTGKRGRPPGVKNGQGRGKK